MGEIVRQQENYRVLPGQSFLPNFLDGMIASRIARVEAERLATASDAEVAPRSAAEQDRRREAFDQTAYERNITEQFRQYPDVEQVSVMTSVPESWKHS